MEPANVLFPVLQSALTRLLRPLVRVLLRHSVPFGAFEDLAKRVYVDVALAEFAIPGKKPSISRASILTGLTRKEVQRLLNDPLDTTAQPEEHYNRAARVLTGWIRDAEFRAPGGSPRPLRLEGDLEFAGLVRRHSGDMPARAVLDELLRVGAVVRREDSLYEPIQRAYVPQRGTAEKLEILGHDVADLTTTIDHNMLYGATDPRFQRKVMYDDIPVDALPEFRRMSAQQAQALLEKLDRWLAQRDADSSGAPPASGRARVGLGIYYFEDVQGPPPSKRVAK